MSWVRLVTALLSAGGIVFVAALVRHSAGPPSPAAPVAQSQWDTERRTMVEFQLRRRGIRDERVLGAMARIPRHVFVPQGMRDSAYVDGALPIGSGQTISQPYIVAFMTEALRIEPSDRVLEIGTGSGYQAAVLAELARDVFTIEILPALADDARARLKELGYRNVHVRTGNGYLGWPEEAPFDRVIITAAPDDVPPALVEQLKVGGIMAVPVGRYDQELRVMRRMAEGVEILAVLPVRFVPMVEKPK